MNAQDLESLLEEYTLALLVGMANDEGLTIEELCAKIIEEYFGEETR